MLTRDTVYQLLSNLTHPGPNRKQSEEQLNNFKPNPVYLLCLCEIVSSGEAQDLRLMAAIEFKNTIKQEWV